MHHALLISCKGWTVSNSVMLRSSFIQLASSTMPGDDCLVRTNAAQSNVWHAASIYITKTPHPVAKLVLLVLQHAQAVVMCKCTPAATHKTVRLQVVQSCDAGCGSNMEVMSNLTVTTCRPGGGSLLQLACVQITDPGTSSLHMAHVHPGML